MTAFIQRRDAAQATHDHFVGVPFQYGRIDCAQMVAFHLRQMGHEPAIDVGARYRSAGGAVRALKRLGYDHLSDAMDALGFVRIAPAFAWLGDVMEMPGVGGIGALAIVLSNGRVLGFHQDLDSADVLQPLQPTVAWRIMPNG